MITFKECLIKQGHKTTEMIGAFAIGSAIGQTFMTYFYNQSPFYFPAHLVLIFAISNCLAGAYLEYRKHCTLA